MGVGDAGIAAGRAFRRPPRAAWRGLGWEASISSFRLLGLKVEGAKPAPGTSFRTRSGTPRRRDPRPGRADTGLLPPSSRSADRRALRRRLPGRTVPLPDACRIATSWRLLKVGSIFCLLLFYQFTLMLPNKFRCGPGRGAISAAFRQPSRQARSPGRRSALRPRRGRTPATCRPPFRAESKSPANPSGPCARSGRTGGFPRPPRPGRAARPFFGAGKSVSSSERPGAPGLPPVGAAAVCAAAGAAASAAHAVSTRGPSAQPGPPARPPCRAQVKVRFRFRPR